VKEVIKRRGIMTIFVIYYPPESPVSAYRTGLSGGLRRLAVSVND
jgi:hypothetical protein